MNMVYIYNITCVVLIVHLHVPHCGTCDTAQLNIGYVGLFRLNSREVYNNKRPDKSNAVMLNIWKFLVLKSSFTIHSLT